MTRSTGTRVIAVIPARMASSRYPGKPLVRILGLPMVEHVRRRAMLADGIDDVVVATCDQEIVDLVLSSGGKAIMTRDKHTRCTDRVEEAMQSLDADIVAIVQGDEPLLIPDAITRVIQPLVSDDTVRCSNLLSSIESDADFANPDIVKAACDGFGNVMFLTRAPIPHFRDRVQVPVYRQTGIMAFRTDFLHQYASMPETPLERAESVDMLRVLENGIRIVGVVASFATLGVDRPSDVPLAENALTHDPVQSAHFRQCISGYPANA